MHLKNLFRKEPIDPNEVRTCKKCGTELASDSRSKLCIHCREERAKKIKAGFLGGGALGVLLLTIFANAGSHDPSIRSSDDEDEEANEDEDD